MSAGISVIIPAYRCERTVEQSVRSALNQTVRDLEVIVIDDASDDGTAEILARLQTEDARVRVITLSENGGVANARNRGASEARAQWVAFLDSDDLWEADKLERQLAAAAQARAALVYTAAECIDETGAPTGKRFHVPESVTAKSLLKGNDLITSTVLLERDLFLRHPMERSDLHEDLISWYGVLNEGITAVGIDAPLVRYRVSHGSKSGNKRKSAAMTWNTYRYLGVGFFKRIACFFAYALHGIKRYWL